MAGYGETGQAKWAAWRRKEHLEAVTEADLDAQMTRVAVVLDPAFTAPDDSSKALTELLTNTPTPASMTPPHLAPDGTPPPR